MTQPQRDFLEDEFLTLSINGALQHSSTYKPTAGKKDPETLQRELRTGLCDIAARYSSEVGEGQHLENIQELARRVNKSCASFLNGDHLRFGVAQKALNLYLKYLWCVGKTRIPPPHCPFDGTVLERLRFQDNWTDMDDVAIYLKWVRQAETARNDAKCESLAEWELRAWNAAQPGGKAGCPRGGNSASPGG